MYLLNVLQNTNHEVCSFVTLRKNLEFKSSNDGLHLGCKNDGERAFYVDFRQRMSGQPVLGRHVPSQTARRLWDGEHRIG